MSYVENLFGLEGKIAVVIGGGGVLAGDLAMGLASAGADAAILDFNLENARARAEAVRGLGRKAIAVQVNVTTKGDLESARDTVLKELGRIDVVINAAGINSPTPVFELQEEEWNRILETNLKGVFLGCQVFGKVLVDQNQGGSIINISSASSEIPLSKVFTYSISKAGVNNLTRFLAREWAPHRVRVNALVPGFFPAEQNRKILTEERKQSIFRHTPMNRYGEPNELIGAVIWLASEKASSFVTGSLVVVDGGFTAMTI
ncbi:MAG: SDR family oxidoreductase [Ignavibacteria bacterium]|nr:SDR family oxidoreductase [Ignavibacteria bacterium]